MANRSKLLEKLDLVLRRLTFRRILIQWFAEILLYLSAVVLALVYLNETIIFFAGERMAILPVLVWMVLLVLLVLFFLLKRKGKSRSEQYLAIVRQLEKQDPGISGILVAAVQFAEKNLQGKELAPLEKATVERAEQWLLSSDLKKGERKLELPTMQTVPVYFVLPVIVTLWTVIALDPVYRSAFRDTFYRRAISQTTVDIPPSQVLTADNTMDSPEKISTSTAPKDNESVVNQSIPHNSDSLITLLTLILEEYQRAATLQKRQTDELDRLSITNKDNKVTKKETEYYTALVYRGREIKRIFETPGTGIDALVERLADYSGNDFHFPNDGAEIFNILLAEQRKEVLTISRGHREENFREGELVLETLIRLEESNSELHRRLTEIQKQLSVRIERDRIVFQALLHVARLRAAKLRIRQNENEMKMLIEKSFARTAGLYFQELTTDERKINETIVARIESQKKSWTDFESTVSQIDSEERDILLELLHRQSQFSNNVQVHLPLLDSSLMPASFAAMVAEMKENLSKRVVYVKENQTGRAAALLKQQTDMMDSLSVAAFRDIPGPVAVLVFGQYSEESERNHLSNRLTEGKKSHVSRAEQDHNPSGENSVTKENAALGDLSNPVNPVTLETAESDATTDNSMSSVSSTARPPQSESNGRPTGTSADQPTETPGSFAAAKNRSSGVSSPNSSERKDSTAFQPETWSKREEQTLPPIKARPLPGYEKAYEEYLKILK